MSFLERFQQLSPALTVLFGLMLFSTILSSAMARRKSEHGATETAQRTMQNIRDRIWAWWLMLICFSLALLVGPLTTTVLFALISFCALREFITITPTARGDHRTLFWVFFIITPAQYLFVGTNWYGMFAIFIPVYAFLFMPLRSVLAGDCTRFLERTSTMQWGLMICVYCISHIPALLMLQIPGYEGRNAELLLFLVCLVEASDILQFVWGKTLGKRQVAPHVSPNKTIEGLIGGTLSATIAATLCFRITPFSLPETFLISLLTTLLGFAGGLVMSAVKRDRGIKDYGTMLSGHGGMMDRIDSLCYAAPVFFHLVRYFYTA